MNNKKYTLKEFLKECKTNGLPNLKDVLNIDYIPYIKKAEICAKIVNQAYYQKDEVTGTKKLHITSTIDYVLFKMSLIDMYTVVKVDFKNVMDEYDTLKKKRLLDFLLGAIDKEEYNEFEYILKMTKEDCLKNEYHAGAYIANRIQDISLALGTTLAPVLETLSKNLENIDENKIQSFVTTLDKNPIFKRFMKNK